MSDHDRTMGSLPWEHRPRDLGNILRRPTPPRPLAERLQEADALGRLERRLAICAPLPAKEVENAAD